MIAYFDRFEIEMTEEQAMNCSHPGPCDAEVAETVESLDLHLDPEDVRTELTGYGAWDDEELQDDAENLHRIVWIAACNIHEEKAA